MNAVHGRSNGKTGRKANAAGRERRDGFRGTGIALGKWSPDMGF